MAKKILWLDDNPRIIAPYELALRRQGYEVTVVTTVTEAASSIEEFRYDLLILDLMIPTSMTELELYPDSETDTGLKTGLLFYKKWKQKLTESQTQALVRSNSAPSRELQNEFEAEGLPAENFRTAYALREVPVFLAKVKALIGEP